MESTHSSGLWSLQLLVLLYLVSIGLSAAGASASGTEPQEITLDLAIEQAVMDSPALEAQRAAVREAEARLVGAGTYPLNPELEIAAAERDGLVESSTDSAIVLSQEVEVARQRKKRIAVATESLEAARSQFRREARLLIAEVGAAFAASLRARELVAIAETDADLTRQLLHFSERRLEEGAGTEVGLNLARATAGQAERALRLAQAHYTSARAGLAEAIGIEADRGLTPLGELPVPAALPASLEVLVEFALVNRADIEALQRSTAAAQNAVPLSKALAVPNLRLGAFYEEEEDDKISGLSLTIPLPFFNRNQGGVAEAEATAEQLVAETSAAELAVRRQVTEAFWSYEFAREAATALRDLVVGTLEGNLELLQRALEAGKIDAADVLVFRREFVEGQRQFIEALFEAQTARVALDLATGQIQLPVSQQQEISR